MNNGQEKALSAAKLALTISRLRSEQADSDLVFSEPIAVVGIGCRFPGGVRSAEEYWQLLHAGEGAISEIPSDRWDADRYYHPDFNAGGKMNTRWGGFLKDFDQFDPSFFGISPREASAMDPQQRVLLEVVWEALWNAGVAPDRLAGHRLESFLAYMEPTMLGLRWRTLARLVRTRAWESRTAWRPDVYRSCLICRDPASQLTPPAHPRWLLFISPARVFARVPAGAR